MLPHCYREEIRNATAVLCLTASILHMEVWLLPRWMPQCLKRPQYQKSLRLTQSYVQVPSAPILSNVTYHEDVGEGRFGKPKQKYPKYCICLCNLAKFSKCKSS